MKRIWLTMAAGLLIALSGCDKSEPPETSAPQSAQELLADPAAHQTSDLAWRTGVELFGLTLASSTSLQQQVEQLLSDPSQEHLEAARRQWHRAHNQLLQARALLNIGAVNPALFAQLQESLTLIDQHPIQPGYLDYVGEYRHSGLVNDIALELTADTLRQQHGFSDSEDVTLGFHAIAYLLWGDQQQRPVTDFIAPQTLSDTQRQNGLRLTDLPGHRRATLLRLQLALLLDDLSALHYKLNHSASAINANYHALQPLSRVQLWRESSAYTAAQIQKLPLVSGVESQEHNSLTLNQRQAIDATLAGLEAILLAEGPEEGIRSLASWFSESQSEELAALLQQARALLASETPDQSLSESQRQQLQQRINELVKLLSTEQRSAS